MLKTSKIFKCGRSLWRWPILMAAAALWMFGGGSASAHVSPSGCTGDLTALDLVRSPQVIDNGQTVTWTLNYHNSADASACDVTGATVSFACPDVTGAVGTPTPLATVPLCAGGSALSCFS